MYSVPSIFVAKMTRFAPFASAHTYSFWKDIQSRLFFIYYLNIQLFVFELFLKSEKQIGFRNAKLGVW